MIEIKNLYKSYSSLEVLKDISFKIEKGDIFGIIGQSGAGKSTLLRCFNGLENFQKGEVIVDGQAISSLNKKQMSNIKERIIKCISNVADVEIKKNIIEGYNLSEDLGFDSISIINLIVELEDEFDIEIDDNDLDFNKIAEFNYLCKIIKKQINNEQSRDIAMENMAEEI